MSLSTIISVKDQLAARLASSVTHANVNHMAFSNILSQSRGSAEAGLRRAEDMAERVSSSDRPREVRDTRPDRDVAEAARDATRKVRDALHETGAGVEAPDISTSHDRDSAASPVRDVPADGSEAPKSEATNGTNANQSPTDTESTQAQNAGASGGAETAAAAQSTGVALGGTIENTFLPALVASLAEAGGGTGRNLGGVGENTATSGSNKGGAAGPTNVPLLGALIDKATARGQKTLTGENRGPGDAQQATGRETARNTPGILNRAAPQAVANLAGAPQAAANPAEAAQTNADGVDPAQIKTDVAAALQPAHGEGRMRATLVASTQAAVHAAPNTATGAPNGTAANTGSGAAAQAPGPQNLPDPGPGLQQAQSHTDAAQPMAQAQAALAARAAAEPARLSFDGMKAGVDPLTQNVGATAGSGATSANAALQMAAAKAPRPALPHAPVAEQVSVRISKAIAEGLDRIEIRLKPAALGNVKVAMEIGQDGRVIAVVTAERPETLEMLKQDARSLERALAEAGLKADSNSLSFNLQGENPQSSDSESGPGRNSAFSIGGGTADDRTDAGAGVPPQYRNATSLLDIHV